MSGIGSLDIEKGIRGFSLHQNTNGDGFIDEAGVQNQWYPIVDHQGFVKVTWFIIYQKNDEAAAKNGEVRITWNGTAYTVAFACADNGRRYVTLNIDGLDDLNLFGLQTGVSASMFIDTYSTNDQAVAIGMKNLKFEIRLTDAPGTNQELNASVIFEELLTE